MRYVSIDIETTGLDPEKHQILEIGAVIEDTDNPHAIEELPEFHIFIDHKNFVFSPSLLMSGMHTGLMREMGLQDALYPDIASNKFRKWLIKNGFEDQKAQFKGYCKYTAAGKNFNRFDWEFLKRFPNSHMWTPHRRVLDPAILYFLPEIDETLPNMATCMERAGLPDNVTHRALDDARNVVRLIRLGLIKVGLG